MFGLKSKIEEKSNEGLVSILDGMANRRRLLAIFSICTICCLAFWIAILFSPEGVYRGFQFAYAINSKLGVAILGVPVFLAAGFLYSIFRIRYPDIENQDLKSEMLSSYEFQTTAAKRWKIWIFSISFGIIHTLGLIVFDLYQIGEL